MKAVFLDADSLGPDADCRALEGLADWDWYGATSDAQIAGRIAAAEVVVSNKVPLNAEVIAAARRLKLILVAATGVNHVDLQAASERAVPVCNARGYATQSVVEHWFAMVLGLRRKLIDYRSAVIDGRWAASAQFCYFGAPIDGLAGKTLGIVGYGELGRAVAKAAQAFGMKLLISARPGTPAERIPPDRIGFQRLLEEADVVSLHCPLTAQTRHLIGARELRLMRSDSLLVNTARGGLVDELALLAALDQGQIGAAALDTLDSEPPLSDGGLIGALDRLSERLLITPHVAWASRAARASLIDALCQNLVAFENGAPRNVVNAI